MATKNLISLEKAKPFVAKFKDNKKKIVKDEYKDKDLLPVCETFGRAAFDKVLAIPQCVGVRVYFGMNDDMKMNIVIVGVDAENKDILTWPTETIAEATMMTKTSDDENPIIEDGLRCPTDCPPPSDLNP